MRYANFLGQQRIEIGEMPLPQAGPGEVLVRVRRTALCGSDLKLWHRGAEFVAGHEIFGIVDQPGHAQHGARVVVYIPVHCGTCSACRDGDTHLCLTESTLVGWNRPGGYAEALAVPKQCLLPVPDDIPDALAPLLLDTIGTSAHGLRMALPIARSGPVLVLGAGPIGLGAILALQQFGRREIVVSDPRPERIRLAAEFGATPQPVGDLARRFPLVVESSGALAARDQGMHVVGARGVLLLLGENDQPWTISETKPIRRKDFMMMRSFYFPKHDHAANIAMLRGDHARYRRLVDREFDLDELPDEFARFAQGARIKPLLAFFS